MPARSAWSGYPAATDALSPPKLSASGASSDSKAMESSAMPGTAAAIYVRVSTEGQEDGSSLTTQEQRCRAYAVEHGWSVDDAHVYRETYSGAELWERPRL